MGTCPILPVAALPSGITNIYKLPTTVDDASAMGSCDHFETNTNGGTNGGSFVFTHLPFSAPVHT